MGRVALWQIGLIVQRVCRVIAQFSWASRPEGSPWDFLIFPLLFWFFTILLSRSRSFARSLIFLLALCRFSVASALCRSEACNYGYADFLISLLFPRCLSVAGTVTVRFSIILFNLFFFLPFLFLPLPGSFCLLRKDEMHRRASIRVAVINI